MKKSKTVYLPVPNFSIQMLQAIDYENHSDEYYLSSAFCRKDKIQWLFVRSISRGYSDYEKLNCEWCRKECLTENDNGYISTSASLEMVGFICVKGKTLHLVLSELYIEHVRDLLLAHLDQHIFSKSLKTGKLWETASLSRKALQSPKRKLLSPPRLIDSFTLNRFQKNQEINLKSTWASDLESPLRKPERLKLKRFLAQFRRIGMKKVSPKKAIYALRADLRDMSNQE